MDERVNIDRLAQALNGRFLVRKELTALPAVLAPGELVVNLAQGVYDKKNGLIVATDRRLIFLEAGLFRQTVEDFPYGKISSVQTSVNMLSGSLTVYASGNKAEITMLLPRERATAIGDYARGRLGAAHPSPPAGRTAAVTDSPLEKLRKLAELKEQGIITEREFEEKKADLLKQI